MTVQKLSCDCGTLRGEVDVAPRSGARMICHCADCRANARLLGRAAEDGVTIWHTTPDRIRIHAGADQLAAHRLKPGGLLRWYAACCRTPIATTMTRRTLPFVGLEAFPFEDPDALGPVIAEGHMPDGKGGVRHRGLARVVAGVLLRGFSARAGFRRGDPFRTEAGAPAGPVHVLTEAERAPLYD